MKRPTGELDVRVKGQGLGGALRGISGAPGVLRYGQRALIVSRRRRRKQNKETQQLRVFLVTRARLRRKEPNVNTFLPFICSILLSVKEQAAQFCLPATGATSSLITKRGNNGETRAVYRPRGNGTFKSHSNNWRRKRMINEWRREHISLTRACVCVSAPHQIPPPTHLPPEGLMPQ